MKLKHIAAIALVAGSLAGCSKDWLDVNTNPNSLPSSTPDYVFTNGLTRMTSGSGNLGSDELGSYWGGLWTQSASYIISGPQFQYNYTNADFNYWDGWYDILADFDYAEKQADASGQKEFKGPARVMKAYIFQQIVDCYGNAPYSEALKGSAVLTPKFDDQKEIYENLVKDLDTAIAALRANSFSGATSGKDVTNFRGDNTRWIQFANSLKLRLLIRQSRIAGRDAYIIAEINKAAATAEGFLPAGVDVGINPGWLATDGKTNPYYDRWGYSPAGAQRALARFPRPTKFLFDNLIATGDTFRMKRLAYANGGENGNNPGVSAQAEIVANYKGVPFGESAGQYTAPSTSYIGPSVLVKGLYNRFFYIFTNTELQFMLAEAKQRYGAAVNLPGTAQSYYEQGVKESFRLTGTAASAATTLLTSGKDLADWTASPDKLKAIWQQKWIALCNFSGLQAWCEYRKNNFPNTPQSAQVPDSRRPLRLFYPGTELGSNRANVEAQGNINVFTDRLFWDVD